MPDTENHSKAGQTAAAVLPNIPWWRTGCRRLWKAAAKLAQAWLLIHLAHLLVMAGLRCAATGGRPGAGDTGLEVRWKLDDTQNPWHDLGDGEVSREIEATGWIGAKASVQVGRRTVTRLYFDQGRFSTELRLPDFPRHVEITSESSGGDTRSRGLAHIPTGVKPPRLAFAIHCPRQGILWVAGTTGSDHEVKLLDETGTELGTVSPNEFWCFDMILTGFNKATSKVTCLQEAVAGDKGRGNSIPVEQADSLPLGRKIEVRFPDGLPVVDFEITLPARHPAFDRFARGWLELRELSPAYMARPFYSGDQQPHQLQIANGLATIRWTETDPYPEREVTLNWSDRTGRRQLLTGKDSVRIEFNESVKLGWISGLLPVQTEKNVLLWKGAEGQAGPALDDVTVGLELDESVQKRFGFRPQAVSDAGGDEVPREPQRMAEFVNTDRYFGSSTIIGQFRMTTMWLLPLLALLWLAWRAKTDDPGAAAWPRVAAGALVFTAGSCAYFLGYRWAWEFPGSEALRGIVYQAAGPHPKGLLDDLVSNSFNLAFLSALVSAAFLLPAWSAAGENIFERRSGPVAERHAWWKVAFRFLQGIVVAASAFLVMAALHHLWPLRAEDSAAVKEFTGLMSAAAGMVSSWLGASPRPESHGQTFQFGQLFTTAVLLVPGLAVMGWRSLLFSFGLLIFSAVSATNLLPLLGAEAWEQHPLAAWGATAVLLAAAAPLLGQMFLQLIPRSGRAGNVGNARRSAGLLIVLAAAVPWLPPKWPLVAAEVVLFAGLGMVALRAARSEPRLADLHERLAARPSLKWPAALAATVLLAWPYAVKGEILHLAGMFPLLGFLDDSALLLGGGLMILQYKLATAESGGREERAAGLFLWGLVFFSVFIQGSGTWLFVPVPILTGWLLARWFLLVRDAPLPDQPADAQSLIASLIRSRKSSQRLAAMEKQMAKKLDAGEMTLEEHDRRAAAARKHLMPKSDAIESRMSAKEVKRRLALAEWHPWRSAVVFATYGAVLSLGPVLAALYDYLPSRQINHPFPVTDVFAFVARSSAFWVFIAFFFGAFFPWIRGATGLDKGFSLGLAAVAPVFLLRLLNVQSVPEMTPFFIWAGQVFLFCTVIGLLAAERRVLARHGHGWRDLLIVHNLPWLSVYASTVIAAAASAFVTIVTGKVGDLVGFFVETILGKKGGGS